MIPVMQPWWLCLYVNQYPTFLTSHVSVIVPLQYLSTDARFLDKRGDGDGQPRKYGLVYENNIACNYRV